MVSRLTLEYDGTHFAGWARQPGLRSVQEELERALLTVLGQMGVDVGPPGVGGEPPGVEGEPLGLAVAGRTDRGVHAWGQVASYAHAAVDPQRLNALLPPDVAVLSCEPAPATWDARRDALSRTYCYRILRRPTRSALLHRTALWRPRPLDVAVLAQCALAIVGRHDFTAFTPTETEHRRFERDVLRAEWRAEAEGELLEFWIEAHTFLRHMNRVLVGTMLEVASGRRSVEGFTGLLTGRPRCAAGPTAPPHGLALASVAYP